MFAALEDFDAEVHINTAWDTLTDNIKISDKENLGYSEQRRHNFHSQLSV
jgi:hypothetical protein